MARLHIWSLLLLIPVFGISQEDPAKQNLIEQRIEVIAEQFEDEDVDFTTLFDELSHFYDNPLKFRRLYFDNHPE